MANYNANDFELRLVEAESLLEVIESETDNAVDTYYIAGDEGAVCISYLDGDIYIGACAMPDDFKTWPLESFDFIRNRTGGILTVDIRNFKNEGMPVVVETYDLIVEGSMLSMQIDAHRNLLTCYSVF